MLEAGDEREIAHLPRGVGAAGGLEPGDKRKDPLYTPGSRGTVILETGDRRVILNLPQVAGD